MAIKAISGIIKIIIPNRLIIKLHMDVINK